MSSQFVPSNVGGSDNRFFGGFFESFGRSLGEGLSRVNREVLPVWVGQQLGLQRRDQLAQPVFVPIQRRSETANLQGGEAREALFDIGSIEGGTLAAIVIGVAALVLVTR